MIKVIVEKRSDAINIYNKSLLLALKKKWPNIGHVFLDNKRFRSSFFNFILEIFNTIKIIFLVRNDDILLFTDPLSFNTIASLFVRNKKYIVFYHYENDPFYYKFLPFISYQKILNKFDGIICISNFSLSQLELLGVNTKKCKVIYCGIDHDLFKPTTSKIYPYDYILSVGSEEPRKNMENTLKSFQILKKDFPNLKLLKVGKVSNKNRDETMRYIKKLRLIESVIFTDYIEEKELPKIYSGAKLLLFPSLLEGFGLPIVEAMACGCPVVTSDRNPMKELVGAERYTVNPLDPNSIAAECKKILLDDVYRRTLIDNGLLRAKEFHWGKTANEIYHYITK
ncbi:MAG: glycosyltransferase family 1 protein [Candidatus Moraniibacteriota bacterium]